MHRAFVLLQVAEVLALLPPARVRDLARRLGTNPGGDDILQSVAQLRPADAKRVVAEADGKAELECADCHARSLARAARDGATYCCTGCHSPAVNIVGAQPMKPLSDDSSSSGRATDDASGGISLTRRLSRSGPAVVLPADRHWQTVPFRNAGPFSLRHVIGNYDLKHARAVSAVAIPPGGSDLVASGGFDHTVKLWDARSGREVVNLGTHRRRVTALATTPGGDTLISGGLDGRVIFWNLSTTRALARLDVKSPLHSLSVSADGRLLALGVESSTARLISARSARPRRELNFPGMKGALAVALNRDGSHLAAAGTGGAQVAVRDVDSGRELLTFTAREPVAHLAFLDGNHLLIVGATTAQILRAGTLTATALDTGSAGPGQRITAVNVTPDGQRIVFGFADGAVRVLAHTGSKVREIRAAHPSRVHAVALDNDMLVSGGADHSVRLWSCSGGQERIAPTGHRGQILRVAVSLPDFLTGGARILSVGEDATARITDVAGGSEVQCYDGHLRAIAKSKTRAQPVIGGAALSRDGTMAATASDAGELHIWCVDDGSGSPASKPAIIRHPDGHPFTAAAWLMPLTAAMPGHVRQQTGRRHAATLAGGVIALGDRNGDLLLVDSTSHRVVARTTAHTREVQLLCAQDDGRRVLSLGADGTARLFALGSVSEPLQRVAEFAWRDKLQVAALSPDGRFVVLGLRDRAEVLEVEGGKPVATLATDGAGWTTAVAITPDSRFVFTAGEHGNLSVWGREPKLRQWANLGTLSLDAATDHISCMTLERDGHLLVAGTARGVLLVFDLAPDFFGN